jgi:hypothetical protein
VSPLLSVTRFTKSWKSGTRARSKNLVGVRPVGVLSHLRCGSIVVCYFLSLSPLAAAPARTHGIYFGAKDVCLCAWVQSCAFLTCWILLFLSVVAFDSVSDMKGKPAI